MTTLKDLFNSGTYNDSDVDDHLTGGTGIDYSNGTISRTMTISGSAPDAGTPGSDGDIWYVVSS